MEPPTRAVVWMVLEHELRTVYCIYEYCPMLLHGVRVGHIFNEKLQFLILVLKYSPKHSKN